MRVLLFDNGTKHLQKLQSLLEKQGEITVIKKPKLLNTSSKFDLIILSGGHRSSVVNHAKDYREEIEFIRKNKKPLIGICLGAELIAFAFGAKLKPLKEKEEGLVEIKVIKDDTIFAGKKQFEVYEGHRWAITELSENLVGLAQSQNGFEVVKHQNLPIYGFQFHPEMMIEEAFGDELLKNLLSQLSCV